MLGNLAPRSIVVVDGLALGALPAEIRRVSSRLRLVALVHHPLAFETGLADALRRELEASERRALTFVRRIIVTSHATAAALEAYAVPADRVHVVQQGNGNVVVQANFLSGGRRTFSEPIDEIRMYLCAGDDRGTVAAYVIVNTTNSGPHYTTSRDATSSHGYHRREVPDADGMLDLAVPGLRTGS